MEAGNFLLTGETILLSNKWRLLNGQHRLNACILAKAAFDAVVIQGLPENIFRKLDSGEKRRPADWLASEGEANAKVFAAALKLVWQWDQGGLCSNIRYPSNDELALVLDQNGSIREFNNSTYASSITGLPGSLAIALIHLFGKHNKKAAAEFFEKLGTGEGLKRGDPILVLRDWLAHKEPGSQQITAAAVIKAWNAWLPGGATITPGALKFKGGRNGDEFPKILGVDIESQGKKIARENTNEPDEGSGSDNPKDSICSGSGAVVLGDRAEGAREGLRIELD